MGPHTISVPRVKKADDIDPNDFDNSISVTIDYGTHKVDITLEPCEFKAIDNVQY